jgi:hypothetical protein
MPITAASYSGFGLYLRAVADARTSAKLTVKERRGTAENYKRLGE